MVLVVFGLPTFAFLIGHAIVGLLFGLIASLIIIHVTGRYLSLSELQGVWSEATDKRVNLIAGILMNFRAVALSGYRYVLNTLGAFIIDNLLEHRLLKRSTNAGQLKSSTRSAIYFKALCYWLQPM